ncbi:MAG: acyl-CoA thioesterase [Gemmatimonadaceae bacterium]
MAPPDVFELPRDIALADIDDLGHVNNVVYLRWVQDVAIARTWVGAADSHRFERHTEIVRAGDRKLLARARTVWCPINRATGRLTRVSDAVRAVFSTGPSPL